MDFACTDKTALISHTYLSETAKKNILNKEKTQKTNTEVYLVGKTFSVFKYAYTNKYKKTVFSHYMNNIC